MSEAINSAGVRTVAEAPVAGVRGAARYNAEVESAPHCIPWTNREQ